MDEELYPDEYNEKATELEKELRARFPGVRLSVRRWHGKDDPMLYRYWQIEMHPIIDGVQYRSLHTLTHRELEYGDRAELLEHTIASAYHNVIDMHIHHLQPPKEE